MVQKAYYVATVALASMSMSKWQWKGGRQGTLGDLQCQGPLSILWHEHLHSQRILTACGGLEVTFHSWGLAHGEGIQLTAVTDRSCKALLFLLLSRQQGKSCATE